MALKLVEGPYLDDILAQPKAVRDTVSALKQAKPGALRKALQMDRFQGIVLTGMGSSFHALHPLLLRLTGRGRLVAMVETSELLHGQRGLLGPDRLLVVVSQSGASVETVRLLRAVRRRCFVVGITNTPEAPLARRADIAVLTRAGSEFSISSKTYVATLAALDWLGEACCGRAPARALRDLETAATAMASYLAGWKRHVGFLARRLRGIEYIFLAGRGASLAAAGTGGLIIKEAAHFPAEGMSAAAFRHGPLEIVNPRMLLLVFEGAGPVAELNLRLVDDVRRAGGQAELVGWQAGRSAFRLPEVPGHTLPLLEILPVEMATLALAALAGREAGRFERAAKITLAE